MKLTQRRGESLTAFIRRADRYEADRLDGETLIITRIRKRLSDGSHVYDVLLEEGPLHCVSEQDCDAFISGLEDLIRRHTNDRPGLSEQDDD